jgi:tripartite-type tricarboxylate transporter receptor subunit TctC
MPSEIVDKLNRDFIAVLHMPAVREKLEAQFFEPSGSTRGELTQFLKEQAGTWAKLVDELGLKVETKHS